MHVSFFSREGLSRLLILLGCLCIIVPISYEVLQYPWFTLNNAMANEIDPGEAALPDFEYINYHDLLEEFREGSLVNLRSRQTAILPGEYIDEEEDEEEDIDPYLAYLQYAHENFILLGGIKIPRLGISENLFEGTWGQLIVGVGHSPGTAMPGGEGNCVISGHRVPALYSGKQPFRYLDALQDGDIVSISFGEVVYEYEVYDRFIVEKYATWVLQPLRIESHVLTLVTCDPVVGPADRLHRLIVRARLIGAEPKNSEDGGL